MSMEITDEMIYAYIDEGPEITATDAHIVTEGLKRVLAIVEREPGPHAFQEYNKYENDCHMPNCRLSQSEHR